MAPTETPAEDSPPPRDDGEPGSDATRDRMIRAAIDIVATEGVAAVTTVNVCRRVGIAQSSYYTHFASRDELLGALGALSARHSRSANRRARTQFGSTRDRTAFREMFRLPLEQIRDHPELFRLGLQARFTSEASPLGVQGREVAAANRAELADDLMELAGVSDPELRRRYEMAADCIEAMITTLGAGHVDGRYPDVEELIDLLTLATSSPRLIEWLRDGPAPAGAES